MRETSELPERVIQVVWKAGQYYPVEADGVRLIVKECTALQWIGQVTLAQLAALAEPPNDLQADLVIFLVPEIVLVENEATSWALAASAASAYRKRYPDVAFAFLTDRPTRIPENEVGSYGAVAFTVTPADAIHWFLRILHGEQTRVESTSHLSLERFREHCKSRNRDCNLTPREEEVIKELAYDGPTNKQLAERLGLSEHTVKVHLNNVFGKTGFQSRAELVGVLHEHCFRSTLVTKSLSP